MERALRRWTWRKAILWRMPFSLRSTFVTMDFLCIPRAHLDLIGLELMLESNGH
jgi:hypothetical protein